MLRRFIIFTVFVSCGFAAGLVLTGRMRTADEAGAGTPAATQSQSQPAVNAPPGIVTLPDLSGVASKAIQSVMNITSLNVVRQPNSPMLSDPLFRYFFGDREDAFGGRNRVAQSLGSGVVVSSDGYIMTNNHVVAGASRVNVVLLDKREFVARVVGRDPTTDVAVIKIDGRGFPALHLGDDARARVGQWVLAIGNPLGLDFTVTSGIVSAKGRSVPVNQDQYAIADFIQTDAAINPGNSGGPLVNIRGEVIGINSAILSPTGVNAGYGFAIPISLARDVMEDLVRYGEVRRAVLGLRLADVDAEIAERAGLREIRGALVAGFPEGASPARAAGLLAGDVIVSVGGRPVDRVATLQRVVRALGPGAVTDVGFVRQGDERSVRVRLGAAPSEDRMATVGLPQ
jgi:serine protease Do